MLMCNNKTFNKIFFFSLVFFVISFISHIMICYAAPKSKDAVIKENISQIHIQQKQIINSLEGMEQKYVK